MLSETCYTGQQSISNIHTQINLFHMFSLCNKVWIFIFGKICLTVEIYLTKEKCQNYGWCMTENSI